MIKDCNEKEGDILARRFRDTMKSIIVLFDSLSAVVLARLSPALSTLLRRCRRTRATTTKRGGGRCGKRAVRSAPAKVCVGRHFYTTKNELSVYLEGLYSFKLDELTNCDDGTDGCSCLHTNFYGARI